jgi:GH25 family lysozyme M1 (1,4-beta-N-acetylmuramidase)
VQLKGARRRRTSARATANEEWDSSFALSLHSVGNKALYTADQTIQHSDTLYSRRAITTRANTMKTTVHSIVHSND